jgi:hypothetical protein
MRAPDKDESAGIGKKSPNPTNFSNYKSREYLSNGISKYSPSEDLKDKGLGQVGLENGREKGILTERQPGSEFAPISTKRTKKLKPKILPIVNESLIDTILLMKECENSKKQEEQIHNPSADLHNQTRVQPSAKKPAPKPANTSRDKNEERKYSESKVNKVDDSRHQ